MMQNTRSAPAAIPVQEVPAAQTPTVVQQQPTSAAIDLVPEMPGVSYPVVPPVDQEEPEARGFVSNSMWTALPPSALGSFNDLQLEFKKGTIPSSGDTIPVENDFVSFKVDNFQLTPEEWMAGAAPGTTSGKRVVMGSKKGVLRTMRQVTWNYVRVEKVDVKEDWRLAEDDNLVIEPAFAPAFVTTVDDANIRAKRVISQVFVDADNNLAAITDITRHCRELLEGSVDCTRYLFRLAVMYVEARNASPVAGKQVSWDVSELAPIVEATTWNVFRTAVQDDISNGIDINYVPWMQMRAYSLPQEVTYVRVLRVAASNRVAVRVGSGAHKAAFSWPQINNTRFYSGFGIPNTDEGRTRWKFYPSDIYIAARLWAARYSRLELWEQMLQLAELMYWARRDGGNAITGWRKVSIRLPPARMRGYLLAPYLRVHDDPAKVILEVGHEHHRRRTTEVITTLWLLGLGHDWVSWAMLDYAVLTGVLDQRDAGASMSIVRAGANSAPIWGLTEKYLNSLGYEGKIGKWLATMSTDLRFGEYAKNVLEGVKNRHYSGCMISLLPKLPVGGGAQGWVQPFPVPAPFNRAMQLTMVAELPAATRQQIMAGLLEVRGVLWLYHKQRRDRLAPESNYIKGIDRTANGCVFDMPMMAITDRMGDRKRFGFEILRRALLTATESEHDRFSLKWQWSTMVGDDVLTVKALPGCLPDPKITEREDDKDPDLGDQRRRAAQREAVRQGLGIVGGVRPLAEDVEEGEATEPEPEEEEEEPEPEEEPQPPSTTRRDESSDDDGPPLQHSFGATKTNTFKATEHQRNVLEGMFRGRGLVPSGTKRYHLPNRDNPMDALGLQPNPWDGEKRWRNVAIRTIMGRATLANDVMTVVAAFLQNMLVDGYSWGEERVCLRTLDRMMLDLPEDKAVFEKDALLANGTEVATADYERRMAELNGSVGEALLPWLWHRPNIGPDNRSRMQRYMVGVSENAGNGLLDLFWDELVALGSAPAVDGDVRERLIDIIEVGAWRANFMEVVESQKAASGVAERLLGKERTASVLGDGALITRCACIEHIKYANSTNSRTTRQSHVVLQIGACPKVLVDTFGGRWATIKGEYGREKLKHMDCLAYPVSLQRLRMWLATLPDEMRAWYYVAMCPAVAAPEHWSCLQPKVGRGFATAAEREELQDKVDRVIEQSDLSGDGWTKAIGKIVLSVYGEEAERKSDMPRRKPVGGMPVTMTAAMVEMAMPGVGPLMELLHNRSPESDESEVAGTTVALVALPGDVAREVLIDGWLDVPLVDWCTDLKGVLTDIRRTLKFGSVEGEQLLSLRKLLNVTIRVNGDSDYNNENFNRACVITRKHMWGVNPAKAKKSAFTQYEEAFIRQGQIVLRECYSEYQPDMATKTAKDFWDERSIRGASGASKAIKKIEMLDHRLGSNDRPGKKVLVEHLDGHAWRRAFMEEPSNRAYYFVKPEPGKKLRSLYATYDEETFISAFANQGVENHMGASKGVMVRQTPRDVLEWMCASAGGRAGPEADGAFWLSTDYSDYNSEHTIFEMCALNVIGAVLLTERNAKFHNEEKAGALAWTAHGMLHSYIVYGKQGKFAECVTMKEGVDGIKYTRVVNGLYSGTRATARDNTWIHKIDMEIAKHEMPDYISADDFKWEALCGDDEDVAFTDEAAAAVYVSTLAPMGHALNPVKQLAGHHNHEFLQLTAARNVRVEKPLNTLLATLATGNWYTQLGTWLQTAVNGVVSNYWEMYCRGLNLQHARRFAAVTLDRLMVADDPYMPEEERTKKPLEWWKFRNSPELPPLFEMGDGNCTGLPRFEAVIESDASWARMGAKDYVATHGSLLKHLPRRIKKEFEETVLGQSMGATFKTWQQKKARSWCFRNWPERECRAIEELRKHEDWRLIQRDTIDLAELRWGVPRSKQMLTEESVCGLMGVPFFVARRLGGAENLGGFVSLEQWGRYQHVGQQFITLSGNGYELQMNLRAIITWCISPLPKYHGTKAMRAPDTLEYVYMGNGSGKTYLCERNRGMQDLDAVWMDKYGSIRQRCDAVAAHSSFSAHMRVTQELLRLAMTRGSMLLGQVSPKEMIGGAQRAGINLRVTYYDPGSDVRATRMARRGWDSAKVQRRLKRCAESYRECAELGAYRYSSAEEIEEQYKRLNCERAIREQLVEWDGKRVPAKYVFDRTEAVTRKLEIEQESLKLKNNMVRVI